MAVCTGSASLTPPERAELLTLLAEDADETVRDRAESALTQPIVGRIRCRPCRRESCGSSPQVLR